MAAAVVSETTATGPTARTRLVPNTAHNSSGATLAYSPNSSGKPASMAQAKLCGMSMMVTIRAATPSPRNVYRLY